MRNTGTELCQGQSSSLQTVQFHFLAFYLVTQHSIHQTITDKVVGLDEDYLCQFFWTVSFIFDHVNVILLGMEMFFAFCLSIHVRAHYSGCMTLMPRMFMNTFIILKICMHEKYQHWKLHFTFLSLCFVPPCFCTFLFFSVSLLLSSLFLHHLPFCSVGLLDWVYWIDYWVWGYLLSHVNVRVTEMRGEWGCTWV